MSESPSNLSRQMSNAEALQLSQNAPQFLKKHETSRMSTLFPYLSGSESSELWLTYEQLLLSNLRTGDDKSALLSLDNLISRFGANNERVMALRGLYQEAVAEDEEALNKVLQQYGAITLEEPTNTPVIKRQVALLKALFRPAQAIAVLVELLATSPTDLEAWAELSDLYFSQAMYPQACFCLEEVLLITPNAWNVHARLGEILCVSSYASINANDAAMERLLLDSVGRFCRSIELCDGYLRGFYGLKVTTDRLLQTPYRQSKHESDMGMTTGDGEGVRLSRNTVNELNERATSMIAEIVRRRGVREPGYCGYEESEIIAAKDLLDQSTMKQQK